MTYAINWDLESIFPGGSDSEKLKQRMAQLSKEIHAYHQAVTTWAPTSDTTDALVQLLQQAEIISNGFGQCSSFINALLSSNVNDSKAKILSSELYSKLPEYQLASTIFSKKLTEIADDTWAEQMATPELATVAFRLTEIRRDGNELLSEAEENIINTLKLDGLNAWVISKID